MVNGVFLGVERKAWFGKAGKGMGPFGIRTCGRS